MSDDLAFAADLAGIVGDANVLTDPALVSGYVHDWTGRFTGRADAVVRPGSTDEVAQVLRYCTDHGIAVHPQGGNTGLVGGSVPSLAASASDRRLVVLSTSRLYWIGDVDSLAGQVTAGAGTPLGEVQRAAHDAGWYYGVDIAARDSATIGGTIATNAGGIRVCAFGMTRAQVAGVEAVLADGSVISHLAGLPKDNTGYDLASLFTGSEGTLGVITAATLRLHRPPMASTLVLLGVPDLATAQELVRAAVPPGGRLLAAEMMDRLGADLVCEMTGLPWPLQRHDWPHLVLIEVEGDGITLPDDVDAVLATDATDYARLWRYREHQSEAAALMAARIGGVVHKLDVSVPLPVLAEFAAELTDTLAAVASVEQFYLFGHIADGNLHVEIAEPTARDDSATVATLDLVTRYGGSISAEHGIGQAKAHYLSMSRTPTELATMRAIKSTLDPATTLAPGVLFSD